MADRLPIALPDFDDDEEDDDKRKDARASKALPIDIPDFGDDAPQGTPGPAQRGGDDSAWLDALLDTGTAAVQGMAGNLLDDAYGATNYALGKLGVLPEESFDDYQEMARNQVSRTTREHPYAHGAGQAATGTALGLASAGSLPLAAGLSGAHGALETLADRRPGESTEDLAQRAAIATGLGAAGGAAGELGGRALSKAFGPKVASESVAETLARTQRKGAQGAAEAIELPPESAVAGADPLEWLVRHGEEIGDAATGPQVAGTLRQGREVYTPAARAAAPAASDGLGMALLGAASPQAAFGMRAATAAGARLPQLGQLAERIPSGAAGAFGRGAVEWAAELGGGLDSKAEGQTAYAGAPTLSWTLQSVLSQGETGLPDDEVQRLTEAVVRGDVGALAAADFRLKQKYPGYARRVEAELRALNGED